MSVVDSTCEYSQKPPDSQDVDCNSDEENNNWRRTRRILLEWVEDRAIQSEREERNDGYIPCEDIVFTTFLQLVLNYANNGAQLKQITTAKHDEHVKDGTCMYEKIKGVYGADAGVAAIKRRCRDKLLATVKLQHDLDEKLYKEYRAKRDRKDEEAEQAKQVWISSNHRQPKYKVEERLTKVVPVGVLVNVCNRHGKHDDHQCNTIDEYHRRDYDE